MTDTRSNIVAWAHWAVANKAHFIYSEGPQRMSAIGVWPLKFPITADCSAAFTWYYWIAGARDPNNLGYNHEGFTGTLLSNGVHIPITEVVPGDAVVYGPGSGWHVGIVVEAHGADILTVSHGQMGDPSYVWVNQPKTVPTRGYSHDGRNPQTFLRFPTGAVNTVHTPPTK